VFEPKIQSSNAIKVKAHLWVNPKVRFSRIQFAFSLSSQVAFMTTCLHIAGVRFIYKLC